MRPKNFLIIKTGYEGIDELVYPTEGRKDAIRKIKALRAKDKKDADFYCVQGWNGRKFKCVCADLGVEPSKSMLR